MTSVKSDTSKPKPKHNQYRQLLARGGQMLTGKLTLYYRTTDVVVTIESKLKM